MTVVPNPDQPFSIAVLGAFGGRGETLPADVGRRIAQLRPIYVDRDNFDEVMARLGARCDASVGDREGHVASLRFGCLDDFHPDYLISNTPVFAQLRQLRKNLVDPVHYEQAAAEVRSWGMLGKGSRAPAEESPEPSPEPPPSAAPPLADGADLLAQSIEQTQRGADEEGPASLPGELAELIRRAAAPYRVEKPHPEREDLLACVDSVASQLLRSILHDPRFQATEAAWRGLAFLVRGLPTGARLKIFLIDVSLDELAADLGSAGKLEASGIYKLLVEQSVGTAGGTPWAAIACNYVFGAATADLLLASCLARIGALAGAPVLAAARSDLVGCPSLALTPDPDDWQESVPEKVRSAWEGLRSRPEARYLGLGVSRFLLRMPYGPESRPIESFPFLEVVSPRDNGAYLWGNPALAYAYLLGRAFHEDGWNMQPESSTEIANLPVYAYEVDDEYEIAPCAEAMLSDRASGVLQGAGLMPLVTLRGTGTARLAAWRSTAASGEPLAGPWE